MKTSLIIVITILPLISIGQPSQTQAFLPKVLPASPEAASISRFGNIPVNMFSGIPDISIPLYEIQVGELKVPITLSYHASGNKVSDIPSWAGLGWSVSAGGTITRKMMGKPDEQPGNYLSGITSKATSEINTATQAGLDYLWGVTQGTIDAEPDIYSYSFPGKSGKFLFNQRDNFKPIIMPYDPITISRTHPTQSTMLFSIVDEGGLQYKFDTDEWTSNSTGSGTVSSSSTWMLTNMISANKQDTISFNYSNATTQDSYFSEYIVVSDEIFQTAARYSYDPGTGYLSFGYTTVYGKVTSEIIFKNGKVVFEMAAQTREDFNSTTAPNRLNAIKIYNFDQVSNTYKLIRVIQFYHSYFINGTDNFTKRLRLDSVGIMSGTGNEVEKYRFEYNTTVALPRKDSKMKDFWGYYNNKDNNTLVPRMQIPYTGTTGVTNIWIGSNITDGREPDPNYMQAWIIKKIIYPTGGYTEFEFESNAYLDAQSSTKYAGGLRIKKLRTFDGVISTPIIKTYKYGTSESGIGRANFILNNYFFQSTQSNRAFGAAAAYGCGAYAVKRTRTFFSNPTIDIEPYDGSAVVYPYVTEYIGDEANNQGRTIFQFNDHIDPLNLVAAYGRPIITSYHFNRGQLIDQLVQKKNSIGVFKNVSRTTSAYEYFAEQSTSYLGLVALKRRINDGETIENFPWGPINSGTCLDNEDTYSYNFDNYSIRTGDNRLKESSEIVFDENDDTKSLTTTTKYYYDNFNHMQATRVETTNSKGETIVTSKKFPHDVSPIAPYNEMIAKNLWNRVIEEKVTNNGTQHSLLKNNYSNWGNNNFLTSSIDLQLANNPNETRAQFTKYNIRGSIQEMNKSDDIKMVYVWDYQNSLPIAEIINAAETEVAYTSFESDGKGNWNFSGSGLNDPSAITGNRSYKLSTGPITKNSGLNASTNYTVSYWTKNTSPYTIAGTQSGFPVAGPVVGAWRCYMHKVSGVTSVTISGSGYIDELRLYPSKAQITTSTYEPLIGATSKVDVNNRITYFEYDAAGRLKIIRDQNKNVRKVYCYNYSGQPVDCNSIFKNAAYSQNFTRNNCSPGNTGGVVAYNVPANTYVSTVSQADADAKAQSEALLNGQDYANSYGSCTPSVTLYNVQGYNTKSFNYNVRFTNTSTGNVYTFLLNANTFSFSYKGQIPSGNYNVQFFPQSSSVSATFNVNGFTLFANGGALFSNIAVNSTTNVSMY